MTLAELQPHVERALTAVEWASARTRWRQGLLEEHAAITVALPLAGQYGVELDPLVARLAQIERDLTGDVTADHVPQAPLRSVPMDLITIAVVRRLLRLPPAFPVLSVKQLPSDAAMEDAVRSIAQRWQQPLGEVVDAL